MAWGSHKKAAIGPLELIVLACGEVTAKWVHGAPHSKSLRDLCRCHLLNAAGERIFHYHGSPNPTWTNEHYESLPDNPKITTHPIEACERMLDAAKKAKFVSTCVIKDSEGRVISIKDVRNMKFDELPVANSEEVAIEAARRATADPLPLSPGEWQGEPTTPAPAASTPSASSSAAAMADSADSEDDELVETVLTNQEKIAELEDRNGMLEAKMVRAEGEINELHVWINTINLRLDALEAKPKVSIKIEDDEDEDEAKPATPPPTTEQPRGRLQRQAAKRARRA